METLVSIIEIIGIVSFSAAGAIVAIDKEMDIFGVLLIAIITCFGGGMLRDVLAGAAIGLDRPWFFSGKPEANLYIIIATVTAIAVFFLALVFKKAYVKEHKLVCSINNILDAIGLGAFAAMGTASYVSTGPFVAITMGMITSIAGGLTRDVILNDIPFVLRKYVYAIPTIVGSALYYVIFVYALPDAEYGKTVATATCIVFVFVTRMLATYFRLNMPKAIDFRAMREAVKEEDFSD